MAFDFLGCALIGELVAADGFADALLHAADYLVEFSFDGAIAGAHSRTPSDPLYCGGEDGAGYGPIRAVRWPNTDGPPD